MKKAKLLLLLSVPFLLSGCAGTSADDSIDNSANNDPITMEDDTISGAFSLVDSNGNAISPSGSTYTISAAGTYTAVGKLSEGQIVINAASQVVELDLNGVSLSNSSVSPIFVTSCEDFVLVAKKDSSNYLYDYRSIDYSASDTEGRGAVHVAEGDLKVKGKGGLYIYSHYNSGLHGKDNVTVKNLTLIIEAMNNGIRGNDKVTVEENPSISITAGNNGIVTHNSDMNASNTDHHGHIYIYGGSLIINAYGDGIDAAYSVDIASSVDDTDGTVYTPSIDIYTNKYSSYTVTSTSGLVTPPTRPGPGGGGQGGGGGPGGGGMTGGTSAEKADESAKAIKANEYINIAGGSIYTQTYDDSIHANNDVLMDTNAYGAANITISDGTLALNASDDAIHADGTLTISGGSVGVATSHEAIEGNKIVISGGTTTVVGSDDGINASTSISISGGRVDVTVSASGDTDGIDSNGSISISGGVVITRGPNSEMAAPIDADGQISITGGTTIIIGYSPYVSSSLTKTTSSNGLSSGSHSVTVGGTTIEYSNSQAYSGKTTVYASGTATIK